MAQILFPNTTRSPPGMRYMVTLLPGVVPCRRQTADGLCKGESGAAWKRDEIERKEGNEGAMPLCSHILQPRALLRTCALGTDVVIATARAVGAAAIFQEEAAHLCSCRIRQVYIARKREQYILLQRKCRCNVLANAARARYNH